MYDTEKSHYITFEEIRKYVIDGIDFEVIESTTEKDITSAILLQAIVEQESKVDSCFSNQALRNLIKISAHPMSQAFSSMFEQTLAAMNEQMQNNPMMGNYQKGKDQWQKQMETAMKSWQDIFK